MTILEYIKRFFTDPLNFLFMVATGLAVWAQFSYRADLRQGLLPEFLSIQPDPLRNWLESQIVMFVLVLALHLKDNVPRIKKIKFVPWLILIFVGLLYWPV